MRHKNIISPYQQRGKSKAWNGDAKLVDPDVVVNRDDLAKLEAMQRNRPLKPPPTKFPERSHAASSAARKDRNGIA